MIPTRQHQFVLPLSLALSLILGACSDTPVSTDTSAPTLQLSAPEAGSLHAGEVNVAGIARDDRAVVRLAYQLNGGPEQPVGVTAGDQVSFSFAVSGLAEGENTIVVRASDAAGNTGSAQVRVGFDATPPVLTLTSPAEGTLTNGIGFSVQGSVTDASGVREVAYRVNQGLLQPVSITPGPTVALGFEVGGLVEGENTLMVKATDAAGNADSVRVRVSFDGTPPTLTLTSPAEGALANGPTISVQGSVTDASGVREVMYRLNQGPLQSVSIAPGATVPLSFEVGGLVENENILVVKATDAAGNTDSLRVRVSVDTQGPVITITAPAPGHITAAPSVLVQGSVTDPHGVRELSYQLGDGPLQPISIAAGTTVAFSFTATGLPEGATAIRLHARDEAGNPGSAEIQVTSDRSPPTVRITSPVEGAAVGAAGVVVQASITDPAGVSEVAYRINDGAPQPVVFTPGTSVSLSFAVPALAEGSHTLTVEVRDGVGNRGTGRVGIVSDRTPPQMTVYAPFTGTNVVGGAVAVAGVAVDTRAVTRVTYQVNGGPEREFSIAPGGTVFYGGNADGLSMGPNTLAVHAYDAAANRASLEVGVTRRPPGPTASSITAGGAHTCALLPGGAAYCWGRNQFGQLGDGSTQNRTTPVRVAGNLAFTSISTGSAGGHNCGLTATGQAYCWGANHSGQLGDETTTHRSIPTPVAGGLIFRSISAGASHTCALTDSGQAYCWGRNQSGQLGTGGGSSPSASPTPVAGGLSFASIVTGGAHTCGLTAVGTAYCWGDNGWGQVGNGGHPREIWTPMPVVGGLAFQLITTGSDHTCGLTTGQVAYCWGLGFDGQLGTGNTLRMNVPTLVVGGHTFTSIRAGGMHTCALTSAGQAYCWGEGSRGQLGDGRPFNRSTPIPIAAAFAVGLISTGFVHTCALDTGGQAYCWGHNEEGRLGDGSTTNRHSPTAVAW